MSETGATPADIIARAAYRAQENRAVQYRIEAFASTGQRAVELLRNEGYAIVAVDDLAALLDGYHPVWGLSKDEEKLTERIRALIGGG